MKPENFINLNQLAVIRENMDGDEGEFFRAKLAEMIIRFESMPQTYEQDGKGDDAIAYMHYFKNGWDWYITERDMSYSQNQAFGLVSGHCVELGYISIVELCANNVELDLHFEPCTIGELKKQLAA